MPSATVLSDALTHTLLKGDRNKGETIRELETWLGDKHMILCICYYGTCVFYVTPYLLQCKLGVNSSMDSLVNEELMAEN